MSGVDEARKGDTNQVDTNAILNRLLILHHRSLPMYLGYAQPWIQRQQEPAQETVRMIIEDQKRTVDRLGLMIIARNGEVEYGEFPLAFAALHDLSFDYLLRRLIRAQQDMVDEINRLVDPLADVPLAQAAAQESLGQAKAHLESLEELAREPVVAER